MNIEKEEIYNEARALISKDADIDAMQNINEAKKWVEDCGMYIKSIYGEDSTEFQKFTQVDFKPQAVPLIPNMINQIRLTVLLNSIEQVLVDILKIDISEWKKGKRLVSCNYGLKGKNPIEFKNF